MYIRNFLTLLRRYSASSALNIAGMAVALASAYLILVQVNYDYTYNRRLKHAAEIYRLEYPSWYNENRWGNNWNRQLPHKLCDPIPEIAAAGTIAALGGSGSADFSIGRNFEIDNFRLSIGQCEEAACAVFDFDVVSGSLEGIGPTSLFLSESAAAKYRLSPGDVLHYGKGARDGQTYTVAAVYRDFAAPSTMALDDGFAGMEPAEQEQENNWNTPFYVRLQPGASPEAVTAKLHANLRSLLEKEGETGETLEESFKLIAPRLSPLTELYFTSDTESTEGQSGNRTTTRMLLVIACLILAIAFINFVNFFFALIPVRIRAINTCKIFGAPRAKLRSELLFETVGLVLLSAFAAWGITVIAADTPLAEYISAPISVLANGRVALGLLAAAVAAGVVVSLYPAWYITSFPPAFVIKGSFQSSASGRLLRTVLVGMQYVISLVLIVSALFIHRQHTFMMHYEMGFDRSQLLAVTVPTEVFSELRDGEEQPLAYTRRDAFTDKLKRHPSIADVAYANGDLVAANRMGWGRDFKEKAIYFQCYPVSWNFLQMMGIEVTEGRDFTPSDEQFRYGTFIFNETARRQFELTTEDKLIGHIIDGSGERAVIAGFCRDFHFKPMQYTIEPLAFYVYGTYAWGYPSHTYIRTVPGAPVGEVRDYIRRTILEFAPHGRPRADRARLLRRGAGDELPQGEEARDPRAALLDALDPHFGDGGLRPRALRDAVPPPRDRHPPRERRHGGGDPRPLQPQIPPHRSRLHRRGAAPRLCDHRPLAHAVRLPHADGLVDLRRRGRDRRRHHGPDGDGPQLERSPREPGQLNPALSSYKQTGYVTQPKLSLLVHVSEPQQTLHVDQLLRTVDRPGDDRAHFDLHDPPALDRQHP